MENKCCEKCEIIETFNERYCSNKICPCHIKSETITQEQDEEERKGMCRIPYVHDFDDMPCEKCRSK